MGTLRECIFNTVDIERETVRAWGKDIEVRTMSGAGRADYLAAAMDDSGTVNKKHMYAAVIIETAFDPSTGERLFTPADRDAILAKSAKETGKLFDAALKLAGLTREASEEVKNA